MHRFTAFAWIGALVHTFAEGTGAGPRWFTALILIPAEPTLGLLLTRFSERRSPKPAAAATGS